ncbi:hypothetical protein BX600DRAFT_509179 [Xylariales sp. PMI_506]|nr:hypothetical protein BX600DRAFT_509179 [Xylariales sp. PMI_506]
MHTPKAENFRLGLAVSNGVHRAIQRVFDPTYPCYTISSSSSSGSSGSSGIIIVVVVVCTTIVPCGVASTTHMHYPSRPLPTTDVTATVYDMRRQGCKTCCCNDAALTWCAGWVFLHRLMDEAYLWEESRQMST